MTRATRVKVGGLRVYDVPSAEYYLRQAELAARLALAESDPVRARIMHLLSLEFYDKADKANAQDALSPDPTSLPNIIQTQ